MVKAKDVTNWYLYGTGSTPTNLVDDSLIRPASAKASVPNQAFIECIFSDVSHLIPIKFAEITDCQLEVSFGSI